VLRLLKYIKNYKLEKIKTRKNKKFAKIHTKKYVGKTNRKQKTEKNKNK
jgi:hypothetical protein